MSVPDVAALALASRIATTPPAQPVWSTVRASIPGAGTTPAASSDGTRLFVSGGAAGGQLTNALVVAALDGSTVAVGPPAPTPRYYCRAVFLAGKHYVVGGGVNTSGTPTTEFTAYTPGGVDGASGTWATLAAAPVSVTYHDAVALDGVLWSVGGTSNASASGTRPEVTRYTPGTNTWASFAGLPVGRFSHALAGANGKLYVVGGQDVNGTTLNTTAIYDVAANTWSNGPNLPAAVTNLTGCAWIVAGSLYVTVSTTTTYVLNLTSLTWSTVTTYGTTAQRVAGVSLLVGSIVYAYAGASTALERIDFGGLVDLTVPAAWTTVTTSALLGNRFGGAVVSDGTRTYVVSGWLDGANALGTGSGAVGTSALVFDAAGVATALPTARARADAASCYFAGRVWLFGGHGGSNQAPSVGAQTYTPAGSNGATGSYTDLANQPTLLNFGCAAGLGNFVYAITGTTAATITTGGVNTVQRYDLTAGTWSTIAGLPASRAGAVAVAYQGRVLVLCGYDPGTGGPSSSVYAYDPGTGAWSTLTPLNAMTTARALGATVVGAFVYVMLVDGTAWRFDGTTWTQQTTGPTGHAGTQYLGGGFVTVGSTAVTYGGAGTSAIDAFDTTATSPFARRVRLLQQFLLGVGLPVAANAARRIPTTITPAVWAVITPSLDAGSQRYSAAVSSDGVNVYVSHGVAAQNGTVQNGLQSINPVTGVGTTGPGSNANRYLVSGAFLAGKHYAVGGFLSSSTTVGTVESYTPAGTAGAAGVWALVAGLPQSRTSPAVCAQGGLLWSFGGSGTTGGNGAASEVYSYNPSTNTWTTRGSTPVPIYGAGAVAVGSMIYLLGGNTTAGALSSIYRYDTVANTFTLLAATLPNGGFTRATAIGSLIYAVSSGSVTLNVFNTATGTLTTGPQPINSHSTDPCFVAVGSTLSLSGGSQAPAIVERIDYTTALAYPSAVASTRSLVAAGV